VREIVIVPIFLGQGGHLLRDLPRLVEELRAAHPGIALSTVPAVGEDPAVLAAMAAYCVGGAALINPSILFVNSVVLDAILSAN
jgi:sirohydrochlorin cobaltochelatase